MRERVTAIMCCFRKIAGLEFFVTWKVRLPCRGQCWDLLQSRFRCILQYKLIVSLLKSQNIYSVSFFYFGSVVIGAVCNKLFDLSVVVMYCSLTKNPCCFCNVHLYFVVFCCLTCSTSFRRNLIFCHTARSAKKVSSNILVHAHAMALEYLMKSFML